MKTKTPFTEDEINQLNELYMCHGIEQGRHQIIDFLKQRFNFSNTHNITCEIRKYCNTNHPFKEYNENYKNSTLDDKLILRINENKV